MPEIKWLDWTRNSFDKSRNEQKPILLDIFGSWCHWCHVMDKTSYSDSAVIDLVNKNFVAVRVDTDKRPDVNRRYNMGGWPSTVFLDSEGKIITGGTYIPPQQLREVLRSVTDLYQKSKGKVRSKLGPAIIPKPTDEALSEKLIRDISTSIAVNFDIEYGGFGFEPKFPHTDALELALVRYHYSNEKEMMTVVSKTLDKMGKGGLYDHVEGGFFRYSTTRDWSIPHFEKMAEDNGKLLTVYLHAFQLTHNPFYKEIAEGIIKYIESNLVDMKVPAFSGSQDADEHYYGLLLEERKKHAAPLVDRTVYTNYNGLLASAYLLAATVLDRPDLAEFALQVIDHLVKAHSKDGRLLHFDRDDAPRGLLIDQAVMIQALLDAYDYTAESRYVEEANRMAEYTLKELQDAKDGGFHDVPKTGSELGELNTPDKPFDENSLISLALVRLSYTLSDPVMREAAQRTLNLYTSDYDRYGVLAGSYSLALDMYLHGPIGISIIGSKRDQGFGKFRREALRIYDARRSLLYLDPVTDSERIKELGYETQTSDTTAYVCVGKVCGPPLKSPDEVAGSVDTLVKSSSTEISTNS